MMNYLLLEATFALPTHPYLQLVVRIHHRSGAHGLYHAGNTGSNVIGLRIRYLYDYGLPMHGAELLQVIQLSCVRQQIAVFGDISFTLGSGEALIVEGENGAGKSSLLRLLAGLSTPFTGNILWKNNHICSLRQEYTALLHYIG